MLLKEKVAKNSFKTKVLLIFFLSTIGFLLSLAIAFVLGLDNNNLSSTRYSQLIFGVVGLALPAILFSNLVNKNPNNYLRTNTLPSLKLIISAVLIMLIILPLINMIGYWNEQLHLPQALSEIEKTLRELQKTADDLTLQLLAGSSIQTLWSNLFFLAFVPAITEELFFRGAVQGCIHEKFGHHTAIWITAIIFSAFHLQFFGFFPRMFLGALLGYMLFWSNSLYIPIIAHFTNNACVVVFYFLSARNILTFNIDSIGIHSQWWIAIISIIGLVPLLYFLKSQYNTKKENSPL